MPEATQMPIHIQKEEIAHSVILNNKNELLLHAPIWINLKIYPKVLCRAKEVRLHTTFIYEVAHKQVKLFMIIEVRE